MIPSKTFSRPPADMTTAQSKPPQLWKHTGVYIFNALFLLAATHSGTEMFNHVAENPDALIQTAADHTVDRIANIAFYFVCLCVVIPLWQVLLKLTLWNKVIVFSAIYAFLSTLWSVDPFLTLRRGFELLTAVIVAVIFYYKYSDSEKLEALTHLALGCALLSVIWALFLPYYGIDHSYQHAGAWQGVFGQKNHLANSMMFLAPACMYVRRRGDVHRLFLIGTVLLCYLLLGLSQSRSGYIDAGTSIGVVLLLRATRDLSRRDILTVFSCFLPVLAAIAIFREEIMTFVLGLLGRDSTLTGRTQIWLAVIGSILKRPWLGYGNAAFWEGNAPEANAVRMSVGWNVPHAHNGILEVWINLGLIGIIFVMYAVGRACWNAYTCLRPKRPPIINWAIVIVFLTIVLNIDEISLLDVSIQWMFFVVAYIVLEAHALRYRREAKVAALARRNLEFSTA